jgi:hypothetical protein
MTTPSGKLAWGQAGNYDAVDDRQVIAAVTRNRLGLVWPSTVTPGSGMTVILQGGWLGVASCGDRTSAVVGSRLDQVINALPGPATGSREDVLWCDTEPDEGVWSLSVITRSDSAGRPGLPLAWITAPANATLATDLTIRPVQAELERRLMRHVGWDDTARTGFATVWENADTIIWGDALAEPGQWYRVRFTANSPMALTGSPEGRIGIGRRLAGSPESASLLLRASAISYPRLNAPRAADVEAIFRHPVTAAAVEYSYVGRIWCAGTGTYRVNLIGNQGDGLVLTVEDIGS